MYSTYLGDGSADEGLAIAVDGTGNAHVAGRTASSHFRTTTNAVQLTAGNINGTGFVTKVNSTATQVLYSTFLGGNSSDGVHGIAVDGQGRIHVTGPTTSSNFPTTASAFDRTCGTDGSCNAEDAFYANIDPLMAGAAGLVYSTFLGGSSRDFGEAIALDQNGRVWITGSTSSNDLPTIQPTQATIGGDYDAFVGANRAAQFGTASLRFASFLGGASYDQGTGIDVDPLGNIKVAGYTGSTNLPVVKAVQPLTAGGNDGFVVRIVTSTTAMASVTLSPANVTGGGNSAATVTLTAAAPAGGALVTLTSSNANAATVPASVTVAAGATTANFAVASKTVSAGTVVTLTGTYNGTSKTAALTVNPALATITLNPSVLTGGAGSNGTVTLFNAAPTGGALVTLASGNTNVSKVPASVTVPAGATSATFAVLPLP